MIRAPYGRPTAIVLHLLLLGVAGPTNAQDASFCKGTYLRNIDPSKPGTCMVLGENGSIPAEAYRPLNHCIALGAAGIQNVCGEAIEVHYCRADEPCDPSRPRNMWTVNAGQTWGAHPSFAAACKKRHGYRSGYCYP